VKTGPLLLILVFGLMVGAVLVVTQAIATAIGSAADAWGAVGVATAEEAGQTERWGIVGDFLSSIVGGASAALI
jgi:hypothetical protein